MQWPIRPTSLHAHNEVLHRRQHPLHLDKVGALPDIR